MLIKPLSLSNIEAAVNLVNKVFTRQSMLERESLRASLSQDKRLYKILFLLARVTQLHYWVAVDNNSQKVIGTTGLYCYTYDEAEAYWLAMFCVDPTCRGQGIGRKLLEFSIDKAKAADKKFLRLYTSTDPNEATAQVLYDKYGFRITNEERYWGSQYKKVYRELELHSSSQPFRKEKI